MKPIGIIDYHLGNLGSIRNMFKYLGVETQLITEPEQCSNFEKIILPGVGHFKAGINNLTEMKFDSAIKEFVTFAHNKLLGICVGMQLLFESSEEGHVNGLQLLKGKCLRFPDSNVMPVPHMGWNYVAGDGEIPLLDMPFKELRFYFAHSYFADVTDPHIHVASTLYGKDFPSVIMKDNIYAVQFHPEKSHKFGLALFNNFARL